MERTKKIMEGKTLNKKDNYLLIGSYTPSNENGDEEVISREFYGQGYIFKDEDAFYNRPDDVCYIPETSDTTYRRQDFFDMVNDEMLAEELFNECDWQHPETLLYEWAISGEVAWCPMCMKYININGEKISECPTCGAELEL